MASYPEGLGFMGVSDLENHGKVQLGEMLQASPAILSEPKRMRMKGTPSLRSLSKIDQCR